MRSVFSFNFTRFYLSSNVKFFFLVFLFTSDSSSAAEELPTHDLNGNEQIVSRGFHNLDTNKNKVSFHFLRMISQIPSSLYVQFSRIDFDQQALDRKEWKIFRSLVATINKNLKKCGRKFLRYCDANQDNKVSLTEWLQCTNTQNIATLGNKFCCT